MRVSTALLTATTAASIETPAGASRLRYPACGWRRVIALAASNTTAWINTIGPWPRGPPMSVNMISLAFWFQSVTTSARALLSASAEAPTGRVLPCPIS